MSKFLSKEAGRLDPYTPGEQPQDQQYIKLNTNESPFPPSPKVLEALSGAEIARLNLYSDPTCASLTAAIAGRCHVQPENVIAGNGSDEILAFSFRAFCGEGKPLAYADITYGFYKSQVALFGLESKVIPLREDFTLCVDDYMDFPGTIVIANPNAPTGMAVPRSDIRRLLEADPNRVVIVDEAYVDFGGESCVPMISDHENLLVVQTMSKSRSLAGGRVGFAIGSSELIAALNRVKYSFNPYNVNRLSIVAGTAAMEDEDYFRACTAADGRHVMKPFWEMTEADMQNCLKATDWCRADYEYFRGGGFSSHFRCRAEMPVTMLRLNIVQGVGPVLQLAEGYTADLPDEIHGKIDRRTDPTWPTTWFCPRLTGEGAFADVYSVMANWGANHGVTVYGHVGADLITLAGMLRIPVSMHNVPAEKIFRPHAWAGFGTEDRQAADYAACKHYGPLYR